MPDFNPYPGLRPFQQEEHHLFFGREEQTSELLKRLNQHRFLAVVGTSGSGKSSLVRAGLLPALQGGTLTQAGSAWEIAVMRPGGDPITNLASAIVDADLYDPEQRDILDQLKATLLRSGLGLVEAVRQSEIDTDVNLLVVVDQFEELFRFSQTGPDQEDLAAAFVELLLEAAKHEEQRIYIAITMRSDYLGDCSRFQGLAEAVNDGEYLIPRLNREQRRAAIEGPVKVAGEQIAPRLVEQLLNDVGDNPDHLPVLQHALMRTWDQWRGEHTKDEPVDLRHYEAIGEIHEALSKHLDEVFHELPSDRHRSIAERLFKALTVKGADNRGVRRPTRLKEIIEILEAEEQEVKEVIDAFRQPGRTFLMPPAGREINREIVVDISHESLMRVWKRLQKWVEEEAQAARIYRRLAETALLWKEGKAGLYRDPDLQIALSWRANHRPNAAWARRYFEGYEAAIEFLEASREAKEAEEKAREEARRRELAQAQALAQEQQSRAEEQRKFAGRLKTLAGTLALLFLIALFASILAHHNSVEAERQRQIAEEQREKTDEALDEVEKTLSRSDFLLASSMVERGEFGKAIAYLTRSLKNDASYQASTVQLASLLTHQQFPRLMRSLSVFQDQSNWNDISLSPNGKLMTVTHRRSSFFDIWDLEKFQKKARIEFGQSGSRGFLKGAEFSPEGNKITPSAFIGPVLPVWGWPSGEIVAELPHEGVVYGVDFSPDGSNIVTGGIDDQHVRVWSLEKKKELAHFQQEGPVFEVEFDENGEIIYALSGNGILSLLDWANKKVIARRQLPEQLPARNMALSPSGPWIALNLGVESYTPIADLRTGNFHTLLQHPDDLYNDLQFNPDGRKVITGCDDGKARIWDWKNQRIETVLPHSTGLRSVEFFPDGTRVMTGTQNRTVRLWDLLPSAIRKVPMKHENSVHSTYQPPDRDLLFTITDDGTISKWKISTNQLMERDSLARSEDDSQLVAAEFGPKGEKLVTASIKGMVNIWKVATGKRLVGPLEQNATTGHGITFSQDGQYFSVGSQRKTARVWDAEDGTSVSSPLPHPGRVSTVAFHPEEDYLATGDIAGNLVIWDWRKGTRIKELTRNSEDIDADESGQQASGQSLSGIRKVSFSHDGLLLAAATLDNSVLLWDWKNGQIRAKLNYGSNISTFEFVSGGELVALGTGDGEIQLWHIETGILLEPPLEASGWIVSLQSAFDGTSLISTSGTGEALIWALQPGNRNPPESFLNLAESLGGYRVTSQNIIERMDSAITKDAQFVETISNENNAWAQWAEWLVADRRERTISPRSQLSIQKYLHHQLKEGTKSSLEEVLDFSPMHPIALARLSRVEISESESEHPTEFYSRKAVEIAPEIAETLWSRALILASQGRLEKAQAAIVEAKELAPDNPNVSYVESWIYWKKSREEEAFHAFASAVQAMKEAKGKFQYDGRKYTRVYLGVLSHLQDKGLSAGGGIVDAAITWLDEGRSHSRQEFAAALESEWLLRIAWEMNPDQFNSAFARAKALVAQEKYKESLVWVERSLKFKTTIRSYILKGKILKELNRVEAAEKAFLAAYQKQLPETTRDQLKEVGWEYVDFLRRQDRRGEARQFILKHFLPMRPQNATSQQIDLTSYYNALLDEDWTPTSGTSATLDLLPQGLQNFAGTQFDVRGVIQLNGPGINQYGWYGWSYPTKVTGIQIGQHCDKLHFLHGSNWARQKDPAGSYRINYKDGTSETIKLISQIDFKDWAQWIARPIQWNTLGDGVRLAWIGRTAQANRVVCLFIKTWDNPHPDKEIESIDFVSAMNQSSPFLVALTVE